MQVYHTWLHKDLRLPHLVILLGALSVPVIMGALSHCIKSGAAVEHLPFVLLGALQWYPVTSSSIGSAASGGQSSHTAHQVVRTELVKCNSDGASLCYAVPKCKLGVMKVTSVPHCSWLRHCGPETAMLTVC